MYIISNHEIVTFIFIIYKMNHYEEKLKQFFKDNNSKAEHLVFASSCHSVEEAAHSAQAKADDFVKNICMIDMHQNLIVAIVKGEDRVSTTQVGKALQLERPRIATPDEILERTGYPCGGTPSFAYNAIFLIDPRVMEKEFVYTGGGSQNSLVKITTQELHHMNNGTIVRVRK